jgi:glyoxylase-like metal-dependent hydrolase (beta-lactamase superfamily II)
MKLGDLEFHLLTDGHFRMDGGAMFGIIPKPLWEKKLPGDSRNRVTMALNTLLIRTAGKWILVETGAGDKWDAKRTDIFAFDPPPRLLDRLAARGLKPEQIDIVINTHLHFDHCGWNTRMVDGKLVPTFSNARYILQRGELEQAKLQTERERASYLPENYEPMERTGQWELLAGDREIAPGVEVIRTPGHTRDIQCVRLRGGGKTVFFTSDLIPTAAHLPFHWIPGIDVYPLTSLASKKKWIPEAAGKSWFLVFGHDATTPAVRLHAEEQSFAAEPISLE